MLLEGELSIIEPAAKTREGIDRDTVTLRARLDVAGRPEAYWLESRGPGVPTPDPDGTSAPKGWTPKHAAFLEAWRGENPKGSGKACQRAFRDAGLTVRNGTFWQEWKRSPVPGTDGTGGPTVAAETEAVPAGRAADGVRVLEALRDRCDLARLDPDLPDETHRIAREFGTELESDILPFIKRRLARGA